MLLSDIIVRSLIIGVIGLFLGMSIYQLTPAVSSSINTPYSDCYNILTKTCRKILQVIMGIPVASFRMMRRLRCFQLMW